MHSAINPMPVSASAVKGSYGIGDTPIPAASPEHDHAPIASALANQTNKMPIFEESPQKPAVSTSE